LLLRRPQWSSWIALVTAAWVQQQKRDELKRAIVGVSKENTNDAIQQLGTASDRCDEYGSSAFDEPNKQQHRREDRRVLRMGFGTGQ
jgi:hypothetical protein